ncbi:MAG: ATP-binding cassette domain-containing protein [Desulfarculaceae bacterium]|nr:ATP-binding cassette domain-containing protein [Desulfarculaceae bacterium]MCF8072702.1 ATP-binding cassette domain-containing protein [Desulfarculaceae bacterium]MCF8102581.1 ATP-binding cassette domain-containing protein [Desulfarculaceae bacterium]MCF8116490.1 ATP-binding cassette domain-containing protein [Desulfarculaceae bacterium]
MSQSHKDILKLEGVSKFYRTRGNRYRRGGGTVVALSRVNLSLRPGEIFGLVGESGSGKTTAGRLVVRLEEPDEGRITLDGVDITHLKGGGLRDYRRKVQMVFQDPYQSLNPQMTIADAVAEPLITNKVGDPADRLERVLGVLDTAGLSPAEDFIYRFPHQLSGGQRQRVAIARAIVLEPSLLVADEPTSMLDASYSAQIFEILQGVRDQMGATIIFITHSMAAARYLCDRIAVIYHGHLVEQGPAEAVINSPSHPYTKALIDATPKFGRCEGVPTYGTYLPAPRPAGEQAGCPFFQRCALAERLLCSATYPEWRQVAGEQVCLCHFAAEGGQSPPPPEECRLGG